MSNYLLDSGSPTDRRRLISNASFASIGVSQVDDVTTLGPDPADAELAATALHSLDALISADSPVRLSAGHGTEFEVPRSALPALARVLESFAKGESVTVLPAYAELTTQQAADVLNVSRPFMIGLLTSGQIDYRTVGTHRRIKTTSLLRYMREDDARRGAAADALTTEAHQLGLT